MSTAPTASGGRPGWRASLLVYPVLAANLVALWAKRGHFVGGWELFGATFGVLSLAHGSFVDTLAAIGRGYLDQRHRLGFTGAESFTYALVPGLLHQAAPWLLWSQLVCLVLFVASSVWLLGRLGLRPAAYWAAVVASPALTSYAIVGYPYLPSAVIPYGLALARVLRRDTAARASSLALDGLVFVLVTLIAFDGYESGKTVFLVPLIGALTLPGVAPARRLLWLVAGGAIAWLVATLRPMSTAAALEAVPLDASLVLGLLALLRRWFVDWYVDFPALVLAAAVSLTLLRGRRLFWAGLVLASAGTLSLGSFQFDGAFMIPQRFLLVGFLSALIVATALTEAPRRTAATTLVWTLLVVGGAYTSVQTTRFVLAERGTERLNYNNAGDKVYPLPGQHAVLDWHLWPDRIHDADVLAEAIAGDPTPHVFLYGFSVLGEDPVNPQVFVARLLLQLGWRTFDARVRFFDHLDHMWFPYPIRPLPEIPATLAALQPPFYVHVREPEYSADDMVAKYLNRAAVVPADLDLRSLRSYRVDAFAPAGPTPLEPADLEPSALDDFDPGFCRTTWVPADGGSSVLMHPWEPLAVHLDTVLDDPTRQDVTTGHVAAVDLRTRGPRVAHFEGWVASERPRVVTIGADADDELALLVNGRTVVDSVRWRSRTRRREQVRLPAGVSRIRVLYHKYWDTKGRLRLKTVTSDGRPVPWRCRP
jgi:hypothetical protein